MMMLVCVIDGVYVVVCDGVSDGVCIVVCNDENASLSHFQSQ